MMQMTCSAGFLIAFLAPALCVPADQVVQEVTQDAPDVEDCSAIQISANKTDKVRPGVNASVTRELANLSALGVDLKQSCYAYTGGSCTISSCDASRNAICSHRRCVCDLGCSGPDGKCYKGHKNLLIAKDFTLKNLKWPKYSMYMQKFSGFGQLKVTDAWSWENMGHDKFSLYQLPGSLNGKQKFFLASHSWQGYVTRIAKTTGTALELHGFYQAELEDEYNPEAIALTVCMRTSPPGSIMIGSSDKSPIWAYIKHGSWLVFGYEHGDPASGGYWMPEPKIPHGILPTC